MTAMRWTSIAGGAAIAVFAARVPAAAQGNSHGNAFGHYKSNVSAATSSSASAGGAAAIGVPGTGVRNFGSWLDDASVMEVGSGFVGVGIGLWKTSVYREVDVPTIDSAYAVHRRVQLGLSVPYFHAGEAGGPMARGFGDVYMNAKIQLRAPSAHGAGFGIIPMVEVLSVAPPLGGSRAHWALPASVEVQRTGWRFMGTGGYFSRGAVFGSGALEIELSKRTWATGSLNHSYSMRHDDLSAALGFRKARTDASGGLTFAIRPDVSVYGSLGRTISTHDSNSATLAAAAGVVLGFK